MNTLSINTAVIGTKASITAINSSPHATSSGRVARIIGTTVIVVADNINMSAFSSKAVVDSALIIIVAIHRSVSAKSIISITGIYSAIIIIIADDRSVRATIINIARRNIARGNRASDIIVDTSSFRNTFLSSTSIVIIAVHILMIAYTILAGINSTLIVIITVNWPESTSSSFGIARVISAKIIIITNNRNIKASRVIIAVIISAKIVIITVNIIKLATILFIA